MLDSMRYVPIKCHIKNRSNRFDVRRKSSDFDRWNVFAAWFKKHFIIPRFRGQTTNILIQVCSLRLLQGSLLGIEVLKRNPHLSNVIYPSHLFQTAWDIRSSSSSLWSAGLNSSGYFPQKVRIVPNCTDCRYYPPLNYNVDLFLLNNI